MLGLRFASVALVLSSIAHGVEVKGPASGVTGEPLKFTSESSGAWAVVPKDGATASVEKYPPRWVIVTADTAGRIVVILSVVEDGQPVIATTEIEITGRRELTIDEPADFVTYLIDELRPLVPEGGRQLLTPLADAYGNLAARTRDGAVPLDRMASEQRGAVLDILGDGMATWQPLFSRMGNHLEIIEQEAGWLTAEDYARVWSRLAIVFRRLAG